MRKIILLAILLFVLLPNRILATTFNCTPPVQDVNNVNLTAAELTTVIYNYCWKLPADTSWTWFFSTAPGVTKCPVIPLTAPRGTPINIGVTTTFGGQDSGVTQINWTRPSAATKPPTALTATEP